MQTTQLELKLWSELEEASTTPEAADLVHLWQELETALGELPQEQRLPIAGKAIAQIVEVFALRCDLILSAWEEAHNDEGPTIDEDATAGLVRQTMSLDLSELMEHPVAQKRQRQSRTPAIDSVAEPVDKAALLEAFASEIELVEAQAQAQSAPLAVAHDENVVGWMSAISQWLELRQSSEPVSLMQLQQGLEMSLVEVWLGLLLAQEQHYELEQQGDFYDAEGIWLQFNQAECQQ
ncbi:MAG TPA: hypothetical protein V6D03_06460 [Candidatus Caenarcaniphilales bacterium]